MKQMLVTGAGGFIGTCPPCCVDLKPFPFFVCFSRSHGFDSGSTKVLGEYYDSPRA